MEVSSGAADLRLMTTKEVAAALRVSEKTVLELVSTERLRPIRLTPRGRYRFRREEIDALIAGAEAD